MWVYIILHPKGISGTLIFPKSTFKNIWKCFNSITGKGWHQIGLYTAIIFEIQKQKPQTEKQSVIPAQNWLYTMFFLFSSPALFYVFNLLQAKNPPVFLVQK